LSQFREAGLLRARGRQRTDSTHVLAAVRALNRLECVGNTFRHALNSLAVVAPAWLLALSQPEWIDRYGHRIEDYRLPESKDDRLVVATRIGADGLLLLPALDAADTPDWLRRIPAVQTLRRVWLQNYTWATPTTLRWRDSTEIPPSAQYISSPYDTEARYSLKRTTSWVGYKIHLTESCDADAPHLITNVATTPATTGDEEMLVPIHQALAARDLLPSVHLADMGFIDAELLVESPRQYGVELLGPVRADYRRQAREGQGFASADFVIDWTAQQATCPMGQQSSSWTPAVDRGHNEVIKIKFSQRVCLACPVREQCSDGTRRTLTVRPQAQCLALRAARARQTGAEFRRAYRARAGIEGTIAQAVRRCSVRQARYVGEAKTHLQHLATASAINLIRVSEWLDDQPRAKPRYSAFERLYRMAA
jgi:transposase